MLDAYAKAGREYLSQEERKVHENLEELQWSVMMDPTNEDKVRECDETEAALLAEEDYTTAADRGDLQSEFLTALDYEDVIVRGWHVYNLCRAKTREGGTKTCGLYFPGKLWSRPNKNNWKFFCCLDWDILIEHKDTSDECARWVGNLRKEYGDKENWPQIGCGSKFVPWKRGPSMVAELMMDHGHRFFM